MMDPVTLLAVTTVAHAATRYVDAHSRRIVLRAEAELARARAHNTDTTPGTDTDTTPGENR